MLETIPPSLINRAHELIKLLQTCRNFQRQRSSLLQEYKSSWLNVEAKVGSKIVFTLVGCVACVFRLASTSTHLFGLRIETAVIFQPNS